MNSYKPNYRIYAINRLNFNLTNDTAICRLSGDRVLAFRKVCRNNHKLHPAGQFNSTNLLIAQSFNPESKENSLKVIATYVAIRLHEILLSK